MKTISQQMDLVSFLTYDISMKKQQQKTIKLRSMLEQILNFIVVFSLQDVCIYVLMVFSFQTFFK